MSTSSQPLDEYGAGPQNEESLLADLLSRRDGFALVVPTSIKKTKLLSTISALLSTQLKVGKVGTFILNVYFVKPKNFKFCVSLAIRRNQTLKMLKDESERRPK